MIANAFTCTGSYAILILFGIKRTENRSAWPEPRACWASSSSTTSFSAHPIAKMGGDMCR
jgi:hypothetical protein